MTGRSYPDEPVRAFPRPPASIRDADGRRIELLGVTPGDGIREDLVAMYLDFDPADRAQGIPPLGGEAIREWVDLVFDQGPDVIARHDDRIVGHATLVPEAGTDEYELAIFILDAYQGRGIGSRLLPILLGDAQEAGITYVWLTVERWNRPAIALYETVGFQSTRTGSFDLEMTITLTSPPDAPDDHVS